MERVLNKIFKKDKKIIIGALHFAPLLGYKNFPGYNVVLKNALSDLDAFQQGGVDGIIIENNYDVPHRIFVNKETVEIIIRLGAEIMRRAKVPIGVSVLWNDYKSAFQIAKNIGAKFIRVPAFVDSVKTSYGTVFADPKLVLAFRNRIGARSVAIFTDIHVKHAELLDKKTIEESAREAVKFDSDALIVTGEWTGEAPSLLKLKSAREAVANFPIFVGSGANSKNIKTLLRYSNGVIVSTFLKKGKLKNDEVNMKGWRQRIDKNKVKRFVNIVNQAR